MGGSAAQPADAKGSLPTVAKQPQKSQPEKEIGRPEGAKPHSWSKGKASNLCSDNKKARQAGLFERPVRPTI
jgi:hypothetical protein